MTVGNDASATTTTKLDAQAIAYFELAVSLYLWRWPALTLAVEHEWGGHESSEKRDWLAGVLADMFTTLPIGKEVDVEDLEDVATQVMSDEFAVALEDDSAYGVATEICRAWQECCEGKFDTIRALKAQFEASKHVPHRASTASAADGDSDSSGTDAELDQPQHDGLTATEPMDLDAQVPREPVIDEDGFELVRGKGRKTRP